MTVAFLDLRRQTTALRRELEQAMGVVLDGGRFVLGDAVAAFEREFGRYCGADHAVGVASGTDAITIALWAAGIGSGDEVVTAANTCVPTVVGIERTGATPVLVDVDPATWTLDPAELERAITRRTRAVIPVHLYGRCADMAQIVRVARERDLVVIEDAAQAVGASIDGTRAGALGDAAAFSFYPTKNLGAIGDGGAIVTNDPELATRARLYRSYGERAHYDSIYHGVNSRLDELQASVLLAKLPHLEAWNERRRALAALYLEALQDTELTLPEPDAGGDHVFHLFVVRAKDRDGFRESLARDGVETAVHYPRAIHQHPAYRHLAPDSSSFPVSAELAGEVVSLPLYPELHEDEIALVAAAARAAAR